MNPNTEKEHGLCKKCGAGMERATQDEMRFEIKAKPVSLKVSLKNVQLTICRVCGNIEMLPDSLHRAEDLTINGVGIGSFLAEHQRVNVKDIVVWITVLTVLLLLFLVFRWAKG